METYKTGNNMKQIPKDQLAPITKTNMNQLSSLNYKHLTLQALTFYINMLASLLASIWVYSIPAQSSLTLV